MNKTQLSKFVAKRTGMSVNDSVKAIDAVIEGISKSLKVNGKIILKGLGSFKIAKRAERMGRNPKTGESFPIPAKKVVRFRTSEYLQEFIEKK